MVPVDSPTEKSLREFNTKKEPFILYFSYPVGFSRELYPDYGHFFMVQITVGKTDLCITAFF